MKLIDTVNLDSLYTFMQSGNPFDAPAEIQDYLLMLTRIDGMIRRIDKYGSKQIVIKHLMLVDKLSFDKAKRMYEEAVEYFYNDKKVSIDAWMNFYADIMDQEINFMRQIKKDTADSKRIIDSVKAVYELRGGNKEVKDELPEELFVPRFVVYTTDAESLGLPKTDRKRIKAFIDEKVPDLTEKERQRLYQEADITPFIALPNEQTNPRKA